MYPRWVVFDAEGEAMIMCEGDTLLAQVHEQRAEPFAIGRIFKQRGVEMPMHEIDAESLYDRQVCLQDFDGCAAILGLAVDVQGNQQLHGRLEPILPQCDADCHRILDSRRSVQIDVAAKLNRSEAIGSTKLDFLRGAATAIEEAGGEANCGVVGDLRQMAYSSRTWNSMQSEPNSSAFVMSSKIDGAGCSGMSSTNSHGFVVTLGFGVAGR